MTCVKVTSITSNIADAFKQMLYMQPGVEIGMSMDAADEYVSGLDEKCALDSG